MVSEKVRVNKFGQVVSSIMEIQQMTSEMALEYSSTKTAPSILVSGAKENEMGMESTPGQTETHTKDPGRTTKCTARP
jgi:hypothetical protein